MSVSSQGRARFCRSCGKPLVEGAAFCRSCGARTAPVAPTPPPDAQPTVVQRPPEASPPTDTPPPPTDAPPSPQPQPPSRSRSTGLGKALLAAVVAGLLVGGGVATAIVLLGGEDSDRTPASVPGDAATVPVDGTVPTETGSANSSTEVAGSTEATGFPSDDRSQMAGEIQDLLLDYHEDVLAGRFQDAWALLSARKQSKYLREEGYEEWVENQDSLSSHLSPAGLTVRIDELEEEGVARVLLTGMGWSKPGSPCSEWSGLTWVKYEQGSWTYDPGYSTTAARRQEWEPRADELLGEGC